MADRADTVTPAPANSAPYDDGDTRPLVLLLDMDPVLAILYAQWLADAGLRYAHYPAGAALPPEVAANAAAAVLDLPFPRRSGARLRQRAAALPGKPILVLSPTFHAGVASQGAVALELGVAAVLPSPVRREALIGALGGVLRP